jgi:hypothetical protein
MKRRFLVVVRAGDRSLHPQWLALAEARNWDLIVHYCGDDPQRYPTSGDGMLRIDSKGPKWPALQNLLSRTRDAWREYDYIWIPDQDLAADCADINRMFELMAALGIELAQPSLSWDSHAAPVLTLHNPNFAVRFSSFVEQTAPCFSRALLERVLPTFGESINGAGLGYVWPRYLQNPATQCAILDRIQVTHTQPVGDQRAPDAIELSYGAIDRDGQRYNLFDAENGEFVFRLCEGYLGKLSDKPELLGAVFTAHTSARAEYLRPHAVTPAPATTTAPAATGSGALDRFKNALAAAASNSAGRVAATTPG